MTSTLDRYGWNDRLAEKYASIAGVDDRPARVSRVHRINCDVVTKDGDEVASPSPRLADHPGGGTLPAVGDWVLLSDDDETPEPVIVAILPRHSAISRRDPADVAREQVLASNIDVVFVLHGMDTELNLRRIERSLVLAFDSGAQPAVVLTKADLAPDAGEWADRVRPVLHDVEAHVTSAMTGLGIDGLAAYSSGNRTIALLGASGAGKSTLVNALVGEDVATTGEVREGDAKGRHTTVTRQLIPLPNGGAIVDTPGLRGLGLWDADAGVDLAFPDITALVENCRFRDCTHEHEPGCAVKEAVDGGMVASRRLDSWRRLQTELADLATRQEEQRRASSSEPGRTRGRRAGRRPKRRH